MDKFHYSAERNVQMVLFLLKAYGIRKVIASPGATNVSIVASMQQDSFFEMYSCVDERSAGYMAVGMADECGEPVVLSCTGATSARNYMPALTEAFYRKLPVIAITSTQDETHIGHLIAQVTDRSQQPRDIVIESVHIQNIRSLKDEWDCSIKLNKALQAFRPIAGPVHINLATGVGGGYGVLELPPAKVIRKYLSGDLFPKLESLGKIAVFIGSHSEFSSEETASIENFCSVYNAVVFCDHTSSYRGKFRIMHALIGAQEKCKYDISDIDLLIHIGEVSGDYDTLRRLKINRVWRVCADGQFRDTFMGKLDKVFAMPEAYFFSSYSEEKVPKDNIYLRDCRSIYNTLVSKLPSFPLSNIYIASRLSRIIPEQSVLYLGILNTLRSWNYFEVPESVRTVCNVGGFGIDGILSSCVGASLCNREEIHFAIVGDLSFFYDMNSIGNRHIGNNLRIIVINNGHGQEFGMYNHAAAFLGKEVDKYVAAAGHYGNKSKDLIKHYAEDCGFKYLSASSKEDFDRQCEDFVSGIDNSGQPVLFEIFTNDYDENAALRMSRNIEYDVASFAKNKIKNVVKAVFLK